MKLYCGIDLHSNNSVVSVIDDADNVVFEKRLNNDLELIIQRLMQYQRDLVACVVESTYNWYWLVDGLEAAGFQVKLAHTGAVPQYAGLKHTNDHTDARHLAHLLRLGILPEGYIMPKEQRSVRDLLRRRMMLVRQRTLLHLSLQSLVVRHTGERLNANQVKSLDNRQLSTMLDDPICFGGQITHMGMEWFTKAITLLEKDIASHLKHDDRYDLMTSIPGVGPILASTIVLETGSIDRFKGVGNYASYARCVSTEKMSNGKKKGQGNKKNGNKYLAWAFMEAANYSAIWCPEIKRFYQRRKDKRHILVAKKTVAHKLARASYHMLTNQEPFDVKRAFG